MAQWHDVSGGGGNDAEVVVRCVVNREGSDKGKVNLSVAQLYRVFEAPGKIVQSGFLRVEIFFRGKTEMIGYGD
ncbi:putative EndoIII-related endonuclease [Sesbania bispinosa]|nr:putative EndoIII-related endonuclease [Sesbania bispinosa]